MDPSAWYRSSGSLWTRMLSRIRLDWTRSSFQEDEELLILTERDEVRHTYSEDNRGHSSRSLKNLTSDSRDSQLAAFFTGTKTITTILADSDHTQFELNKEQHTESFYEGEENTSSSQIHWSSVENATKELCKDKPIKTESFPAHSRLQHDQGSGGRSCPRASCISVSARASAPPTISTWQAGWNVTNAIQGIFVLGLPFTLVQSGYVGLVLLALAAWVCNYTGRILVACLYEVELSEENGSVLQVRVRHSYQDIMGACCKGLLPNCEGIAGLLLNIAQVLELLMTCTLYLLVSTNLLFDSLAEAAVPRSLCSLVSLLLLLPCLLLTDLRPVSALSLLCSLAHVITSLLVMLHCLSCARSWDWSSLSLSVDPENFLVSVGVIIFSYTSQIFLPSLEGSMQDRGQFNTMLGWTHGAACVMKTLFSLLAALTWGPQTKEVITDNLPPSLRPAANLCLLAKALLSYPLPFYAAAEILQSCFFRDVSNASSSRRVTCPVLAARAALLMTSYLLALLVPKFSLLMGLTGSVTGSALTLILPCLFHLRLRWVQLTVGERLTDVSILVLGVLCSISGVICSLKRLVVGT